MELDLYDETNQVTLEQKKLVNSLLAFAGDHLQLPADTEMSVTFVDDENIQKINKTYRGKDQPTDVISFAMEDEVEDELMINFDNLDEPIPRNIGDIIISVDKTATQAEEYGHSFDRELGFLALHGFLHLNGYDHMNPEDEKEMFGLQKEILEAYGLKR
ncbi:MULTISPECIES: rRNA maturation RNase YbeY [Carnobacterium]|uniref:Endoribonuclease YbeY n=2 Tax=Carnobacterium inhibens TaxID=147709 RepID=U5S902_9LACT|nr:MULTISPECIES: rRNA maturation RNase YbeY [Carnobacterium]AGY81695.1 rRNA maturation factor [Carnobacterium inhibens subsp. gilichinskyi]MBC9824851.1 rRNA maturation RNase YbeY [Carnobacterium inhibens]MCM3512535.1 rRNA maturation RNase YbeY [Carnobacterium inhibens]MDN5372457.1 putative rRNA maturation factor [Carnobacterium sp.]